MGHVFLSESWFGEVKRLTDAADIEAPTALKDLVINVTISGAPDGDVEARMVAGQLHPGAAADAPTTLKLPFEVARKMMVEGDQNAAMQAFMAGEIQVEGDMSKLMQMQAAGGPGEGATKLAERIREMTE